MSMTENEALKMVKGLQIAEEGDMVKTFELKRVLIKALEDIQLYRAIGTVEECRDAVERMKPKKPIEYPKTRRADCPNCGATVRGIDKPYGDYCSRCGQAIDWREERENEKLCK